MRNVDKTIEQARSLGSDARITTDEAAAIRDRSIKEQGKVDAFKLIEDAYSFGFMLGYRLGKGKEKALL